MVGALNAADSGESSVARSPVVIFDQTRKDGQTYVDAVRTAAPNVAPSFLPDARTALQFLADFFNEPPRVLVLDWANTEVAGDKFLEWIRTQPHLHNLKIIVTARDCPRSALLGAHKAGADRFVSKEPTPQAFFEKMIDAIRDCLR
jgi:CheY-like chemotaxis protein